MLLARKVYLTILTIIFIVHIFRSTSLSSYQRGARIESDKLQFPVKFQTYLDESKRVRCKGGKAILLDILLEYVECDNERGWRGWNGIHEWPISEEAYVQPNFTCSECKVVLF